MWGLFIGLGFLMILDWARRLTETEQGSGCPQEKDMKLLIIGGSGHVSGAVVRAALGKDYEVWTITRGKRVLGVELTVHELSVGSYLDEHPEAASYLCHRIYDLRRISASGLSVPSTPITEGFLLHVEGLLAGRATPKG